MEVQIQARRRALTGPEACAVDTWLRRYLARLHDPSLSDAVPSELMALVEHFDA